MNLNGNTSASTSGVPNGMLLSTGDRLWSTFRTLRPMATIITHDTLDWYGWDEDGAGVHDVIGTRCGPYTNLLLRGWNTRGSRDGFLAREREFADSPLEGTGFELSVPGRAIRPFGRGEDVFQ